MESPPLLERVERVRAFNRFYTERIGVLHEGMHGSDYSLTEARVLFEIAHAPGISAAELGTALGLDAGYLSRVLRALDERGLLERTPSATDGRRRVIALTEQGQEAFAVLNGRSRRDLEGLLAGLSHPDQERLVGAMGTIVDTLSPARPDGTTAFVLRPHQPGDIGWIIHRHAVLYEAEHGWDVTFEGLVARILGAFAEDHDPRRERSWVAELDGRFAGCVFVVREDDRVARLRCLLVEPFARGRSLGSRLVDECVRFSRRCGYERLTLWTSDELASARHIYQRAGFTLTAEDEQENWGHQVVTQTWDLDLRER